MRYETIPPPATLAAYVRFFWIMEAEVCPEDPFVYRSMADGCVELMFHYQGCFEELLPQGGTESSFLAGIQGPSRCSRRFRIAQRFGIFCVYLYPYALPALFGLPADQLSNQLPDLAAVLGREGAELEEKIMMAANNSGRLKIMIAYLEGKLRQKKNLSAGLPGQISTLIRTKGNASVKQLAAESFLSVRQFERNFKACAGFSPKLYLRILRFQEAVARYDGQKTLTELAYACGYADQSHFIQDCKEFSGQHPAQLFRGKKHRCFGPGPALKMSHFLNFRKLFPANFVALKTN